MAWYCPQDDMDCGTAECGMDERGRCKRCGKPPVDVSDRNKPWMWCDLHDRWHDGPCRDDSARHCCRPVAA